MSYQPSPLHTLLNLYQVADFLISVPAHTTITECDLAPYPPLIVYCATLNSTDGRKELVRWQKYFKSNFSAEDNGFRCIMPSFTEPRQVDQTEIEGVKVLGLVPKITHLTPVYNYEHQEIDTMTKSFRDLIECLINSLPAVVTPRK